MAELVFVVGSGRCGTKMITKLFAGVEHIEAHHEYVRDFYQREAALWYMHKIPQSQIKGVLEDVYCGASRYSTAKYFLDASNKLSWCVDVLAEAFPTAKFIHLVRDGRKVVSSFYHKLNVYTDFHQSVLRHWMDSPICTMPPPNEEYWWPLAPEGLTQFQRICWHWVASNRVIMENLPNTRSMQVGLEDLASDHNVLENFMEFLEIPESYEGSFMQAMQTPQHVYQPIDYPLTSEQNEQFNEICGDMMKRFGYISEEYRVNYGV